MIEGVKVKNLKVIPDERGRLMEILRSDDPLFSKFGQVYITVAYPGVVKAWHKHGKQVDNFVIIRGMAKFVLYDDRNDSKTKGHINEFFIGGHNQQLIQVPPGVYHGFKAISTHEVIALNVPTECYNHAEPDEQRIEPHSDEIPYDWSRKDR